MQQCYSMPYKIVADLLPILARLLILHNLHVRATDSVPGASWPKSLNQAPAALLARVSAGARPRLLPPLPSTASGPPWQGSLPLGSPAPAAPPPPPVELNTPPSTAAEAAFFTATSNRSELLQYAGTILENLLDVELLGDALDHLNAEEIPFAKIQQLFDYARDRRFFPNRTAAVDSVAFGTKFVVPRRPGAVVVEKEMQRRLTWLYPDDGCSHRSEMVALWASDIMTLAPRSLHKIFLFGNLLNVTTPYTLSGWTSWAFHSAPLIRSTDKRYYVIDPSMNFTHPLPCEEWIARQLGDYKPATSDPSSKPSGADPGSRKQAAGVAGIDGDEQKMFGFVVTNRFVFNPTFGNQCNAARPLFDPQNIFMEPYNFLVLKKEYDDLLDKEWQRVGDLGLDPNAVLGESPPWKS